MLRVSILGGGGGGKGRRGRFCPQAPVMEVVTVHYLRLTACHIVHVFELMGGSKYKIYKIVRSHKILP